MKKRNRKCGMKLDLKKREAETTSKAKFCISSSLSFTIIHNKTIKVYCIKYGNFCFLIDKHVVSALNQKVIVSAFQDHFCLHCHALFLVYASNCDVSWDRNKGSVTVFGREKGREKACRAFILFSSSRSHASV